MSRPRFSSSTVPVRARAAHAGRRFAARAATITLVAGAVTGTLVSALAPRPAHAQWSTAYQSSYLQASHNWVFRDHYQSADRLFNAFDYGHAILYETLLNEPNAPTSVLEQGQYEYLTKHVLVKPPRVPLAEAAIEINYAKLVPEALGMFDWAHILHRQLYDVLADERLDQGAKDREVQRLVTAYKARPDLAFSSTPKSMKLMEEQPYSLAFRKHYPKFNGLIWGYHWLQVGLYEPLMVGRTVAERQAGVRATVAKFWQMLQDPPRSLPYMMPMTAEVAPTFATRYPEAAIIFDNLHSMHDVISDILANPSVPRDRKRAEILLASRRYRDDTTLVMASTEAWRTMAHHMGIENMGGPSVGLDLERPTPTVTLGAVMQHDDRTGQIVGFAYGRAIGNAHTAMGHMAATSGAQPGGQHGAGHDAAHGTQSDTLGTAARGDATPDAARHATSGDGPSGDGHGGMAGMHDMGHGAVHIAPLAAAPSGTPGLAALHARMMQDSVIRRRVMADPELRRLLRATTEHMPAEHEHHPVSQPGNAPTP